MILAQIYEILGNSGQNLAQLVYVLHFLFKPSEHSQGISKLEACIADVRSWAIHNKLMLNDNKTEIVHVSSKFRKTSSLPHVNIGGIEIASSSSAKDLGVVIDSSLQLKHHIRNICRSASYGVYKIGKLRKYLDQDSTERLVHAFVSSRLDCNNSLLYGLPDCDISSLQRIQNSSLATGPKSHSVQDTSPNI